MALTSETVKKDVVDQLYWDGRVDASSVSVQVDGGCVRLSGTVPTYTAKEAARADAWEVPGVVLVEDDLTVDGPRPLPSDEILKGNVESVLSWNADVDAADISVDVLAGEVTLKGTVDSLWKKLRAEDVVYGIIGVTDVVNELAIVPTADILDETIAREVVEAIDRRIGIDAETITVEVVDGVVTLSGMVPDWFAKNAAYRAALYTTGVKGVRDTTTLQRPL